MINTFKKFDQINIDKQYCWGCGKTHPLSRAHIIRKSLRKDLENDLNNIAYLCMGDSNSCHRLWDDLTDIDRVKKMKCFDDFMSYIEKKDNLLFERLKNKISL